MTPIQAFVAVVALAGIAATVAVAREERARRRETVAPAESLDMEALLWAIRQRETGDNPAAVGLRGERSAYQFTRATWEQHTRMDFGWGSLARAHADAVARKHVVWIVAQLARRQIQPLPEFVAAAWNGGVGHALRGARSDYAQAVAALYWDRIAQLTPRRHDARLQTRLFKRTRRTGAERGEVSQAQLKRDIMAGWLHFSGPREAAKRAGRVRA